MPTSHNRIICTPEIVTDSPPSLIEADLNTSLSFIITTYQPQVAVIANALNSRKKNNAETCVTISTVIAHVQVGI